MRSLRALLAVTLVAGCAGPPERLGGEYPEQVYTRVISLSPGTTELVAMLEANNYLIGRTAACDYPELVRNVQIVANHEPDIERITRFQPDLILVDPNLVDVNKLQPLRDRGVTIFEADVNSVDDWIETTWEIGALLLQHQNASRQVDRVRQAVSRATVDPILPAPRVVVVMGGRQPWVAGVDSFQADVVRSAGGEPVGPPGRLFAQVNPEQIVAWNPDFVVASDDPEDYTGPAWESTDAFRAGRIIGAPANLLLRPGMRVADLINVLGTEFRRN